MSKVQGQQAQGKKPRHGARKDLTGQRFGKWTVLSMQWGGTPTRARCRCDCGTERDVAAGSLTYGISQGCGCDQAAKTRAACTTHGLCHGGDSPTYSIWLDMHRRCYDPRRKHYVRYGGRGIYVCEAWHKVETFVADLGLRPSDTHSLDRINNDGSYTCGKCAECRAKGAPANVRWATPKEQVRNRSVTFYVTWKGETLPLAEWAERVGLPQYVLHSRIVRNWPLDIAFTAPYKRGVRVRLSRLLHEQSQGLEPESHV